MNGKTTFTQFQVDNLNQPLLYKLNKLRRNLNKHFKYYDIRKIDVDYDKHKNFYKYMKELAYLKYRKKHLVKIFRRNYFNILTQKELNVIKRRNSHHNPYHQKSYHALIYRNLYNYQYKPYAFPLKKEDKINRLNLTDAKLKRKKGKKIIFVNPYLDKKIKYLTKVNQRLNNRNHKNEKNQYNKIDSFNLKKSRSVLNYNKYYLYNNHRSFKKIDTFPKIKYNKSNFNSLDNNLNDENTDNSKKMKLLNINKNRMILLPKIKNDILSTISSSKKLEKDLNIFKYGKKETPKKEENIDESNLLNVSPRKLFKLFFGIKKSKSKSKPKKVIIKNNNKTNTSSKINNNKQNNTLLLKINNNSNENEKDNISKDIKKEKEEIINDISFIKEKNISEQQNENLSNNKNNIFSF